MRNSSLFILDGRHRVAIMNPMDVTPKHDHKERRKPGPVPGPPTRKVNILLEEELAEWGKQQPGGLSEMVRRLLQTERRRTHEEKDG